MKVQSSTLIGLLLDWAVAKSEGISVVAWYAKDREAYFVVLEEAFEDKEPTTVYGDPDDTYYPSVLGGLATDIIEREGISVGYDVELCQSEGRQFWATVLAVDSGEGRIYGPTHRVAAMRCLVINKLGAEIDVPDELMPQA